MDRNFRLLVLGVVLVQLATLKETSFVVLGKVSYGKQHFLEPKKWWLARIFSASGHENWRFGEVNTNWQIALLLSIASHWKVLLLKMLELIILMINMSICFLNGCFVKICGSKFRQTLHGVLASEQAADAGRWLERPPLPWWKTPVMEPTDSVSGW